MSPRRCFRWTVIPLVLAATLQACGGGGGSAPFEDGGTDGNTDGNTTVGEDPPILGEGDLALIKCDGSTDDADSDTDGLTDCEEKNRYGTNPFVADTDGDGYDDMNEVVFFNPQSDTTRFNPVIADLARIEIELDSVPSIALDFTEVTGASRTVATSHSDSDTSGLSRNWGGETSRQLEIGHTVFAENTQSVGVEVKASNLEVGGSTSYENSLTLGLQRNRTQTVGSSVDWSSAQTQENTRAFSETEEVTQNLETKYEGGRLTVLAKVINDGNIAYDLENLTLSAFIFDPKRPFDKLSVGNLEYTSRAGGSSFPTTSIQTQTESTPFNFGVDIDLALARELLRDSSNLVIEPATFRLIDSGSNSAALNDQDVSLSTATISVDFGRNATPAQSHRVAVNLGDEDKAVSALYAMTDMLGYQVEQGTGNWVYGDTGASRATAQGLLSVNGVSMSETTNSYWLLAWNYSTGGVGGSTTTKVLNLLDTNNGAGYNLDEIMLQAGDKLHLVYVSDTDRDALADRFEEIYGTDKSSPDTDGDSLGDAIEIYGFFTNLAEPPCDSGPQFRVTSNPLLMDSDGDGITDDIERANCENPSFAVTAKAGLDQTVNVNTEVTLNGEAEGLFTEQPVFTWKQVGGPAVQVDGEDTALFNGRSPSFMTTSEVGTLLFDLTVTVEGASSTDRVVVQVQQDRLQAVYVGANNSVVGDGTQANPYPTLLDAINSIQPGEDLYVMTLRNDNGVIPYTEVNSLNIPAGTDMFGGYDKDWVRDIEGNKTPVMLSASSEMQAVFSYAPFDETMRLSGFALRSEPASPLSNSSISMVALKVEGSGGAGHMIVTDNSFITGDVPLFRVAQPGSNYGAYIRDLSKLDFFNNNLVVGNAGRGVNGTFPSRPAKAPNGSDGTCCGVGSGGGGGTDGPQADGGRGGDGGANVFDSGGDDGRRGADAGDQKGGAGGKGAAGKGGLNGAAGATGYTGANGAAAGDFDGSRALFTPAIGKNGRVGGWGAGGGGGAGGSENFNLKGGGGGGGGSGGTWGRGGTAGAGGGASIGIWLYSDSGMTAVLRSNVIQVGHGGNAGDGSFGGSGGYGGTGGDGALGAKDLTARAGGGGRGGNGGTGGRGGAGSGGSGGPSLGIFAGPGLAPLVQENSITTGNGGNGGNTGNTGNGGDSVAVFDGDTTDNVQPVLRNNQHSVSGSPGAAGNFNSNGGIKGQAGCSGMTNC